MHRKSLEAAELLQKTEPSNVEFKNNNLNIQSNLERENYKSNNTNLDSVNSVAVLRAKAKQHLDRVQNGKKMCK